MFTIQEVGENAGKIWHTLGEHGAQTIQDLVQRTGLQVEKVCISLGWLAHENKIVIMGTGPYVKFDLNSIERNIYYSTRRK